MILHYVTTCSQSTGRLNSSTTLNYSVLRFHLFVLVPGTKDKVRLEHIYVLSLHIWSIPAPSL